jgi:predicted PurR-regulated permease PerM
MEDEYLKRTTTTVVLLALAILSFLVLKPILMSIILGIVLAVIFSPLHNLLLRLFRSSTISASLICLALFLLIIIPFWFLTPIFVKQSFQIYQVSQQVDFVSLLKTLFPSFFASEQFSNEIGSVFSSFITKVTNAFVNWLSQMILNFPAISLQLLVIFFTFFFVLRDNEYFSDYLRNILPFQREVKEKLFLSSKDIIYSVIYGQIIIGTIQGIIAGIGFFAFGVNNAFLFTFLAILAGIFPIIGTAIVWIPIMVYLLIGGNTVPAFGVAAFGIISSLIDNIMRPIFVSRYTDLHPLLVLVGMIGGLFFFGILGLVLGPLIIAYAFIMLEIYRGKQIGGIFVQEKSQ